ncbi:MAG: hypothetical protein V3R87_12530 [Dehalococcoidia bacterium]
MGAPPRKFQIGDRAVPLRGLYRGDVGTVIDTKTIYVRNAKNPEKPLPKVRYTVRLDSNVVRKYFSVELEHP